MNIKFENIFDLSIKQLKANWGKLFINSILYGIIIFLISLVYIFVVVILGAMAMGLANINGILGIIMGLLAVIVFILFIVPITFLSTTTDFIVAKSAMDDNTIGNTVKGVCTKKNFLFYTTHVLLPLAATMFGYFVFVIISFIIGDAFGLLMLLLLLVPIVLILLIVTSGFKLSLYKGYDVKGEYQQLTSQYTRKQILFGYLIQVGLLLILNMVLGLFQIIPIIGFIINVFLGTVGGAAITQAMIIALSGNAQATTSSQSPSTVTIKTDSTTVIVNTYGAQITSVTNAGVEYMWQADPEYWGRTAPVLFPFVGKLKDDKYQAGGQMIAMNQHGFLRDRNFTIVSQTVNSVTFEYTSTLADFDVYPVDFTVQITYQVTGNKVTTTYNVINNSSYEMPYQIGAHPAFNVESVDDLTAVFKPQTVTKHYFAAGLQSKTEQFELESFDLSYDLINDNLPCYSDFKDHTMMLQKNGKDFLNFDFNSMKYLAIWSPEFKQAKFICIEPWNGICSRQDQDGYLLADKDGVNYLAAESSESCSFSFEIC